MAGKHEIDLRPQYQAAAIIRQDSVGSKLGFDAFEYPIWLMLKQRGFTGTINQCYVERISGRIPAPNPVPAAIIARLSTPPAAITNLYPRSTAYGPLMVLWRDDAAATAIPQQAAAQ